MNYIVEICTGSYEDCIAAAKGGAKRVELNSALSVGGLTASLAVLKRVKKETDLKVICMVRPRAAGFCYGEEEYLIMLEEAALLLDHGADGIAFGFLHADATVNVEYTNQMTERIHSYQKEAVFHRAFDVTKDPIQSIEQLIACKVDRVLTSGQCAKAIQGIDLIRELQIRYGKQIEILAGSGVNANNVKELFSKTGINQVHSSCKSFKEDPTTFNRYVSYAYLPAPHEREYDIVDEQLVQQLVQKVEELKKEMDLEK